jgi:hypothetical protein
MIHHVEKTTNIQKSRIVLNCIEEISVDKNAEIAFYSLFFTAQDLSNDASSRLYAISAWRREI